MDVQTIMSEIKFTKTLENVSENDYKIDGGKYIDKKMNVNLIISIYPVEKQILSFKVYFKENPEIYPFWVVIDVKIQDKIDHFLFIKPDNYSKKSSLKTFYSIFNKSDLSANVNIEYRLQQIPVYCSTFANGAYFCYLNSIMQLLFRLSKFRKLTSMSGPAFLKQMKALFDKMKSENAEFSTEDLALSFGWPRDVVYSIQEDASEFLNFLLNRMSKVFETGQKNISKKKILNDLFESQFIFTNTKHNTKTAQSYYMLYTNSFNSKTESIKKPYTLLDKLKAESLTTQEGYLEFTKYPEVLFIQVNDELDTFEPHIDLLPLAVDKSDSSKPHHNYTLCGFVIREAKEKDYNSGHFLCLVRSEIQGIWHYFSDSTHGTYEATESNIQSIYKSYLVRNRNTIKGPDNYIYESKIRVLMYVADDVLDKAFEHDKNVIPKKNSQSISKKTGKYSKCEFKVITRENLKDHIKEGYTDFVPKTCACSFELINPETDKKDSKELKKPETDKKDSEELKKSSIYKEVSEKLEKPIDSFFLMECNLTQNYSPSGFILENNDEPLNDFVSPMMNLFCFDYQDGVTQTNEINRLVVPFIFLHYEFAPEKFLHRLENNLAYSKLFNQNDVSDRAASLQPIRPSNLIFRPINLEKKDEEKLQAEKIEEDIKLYRKDNFRFVDIRFLSPNAKLSSVKDELLQKLGKPKDSKLAFYIAQNSVDPMTHNINVASFKQLNIDAEINTFNNQNIGQYIYIQCIDNQSIDNKPRDLIDKVVDKKLLFFKYMDKALNVTSIHRTLPTIYLMERFSVPVTFVKIDDPSKQPKTILFPFKFAYEDMESVYKIICAVMDESYDANSQIMEVFLSFRKGWSPINVKVTDIKVLKRALEKSLECFSINSKKIYSKKEIVASDTDSDSDYDSDYDNCTYQISLHYNITRKVNNQKFTFRVEFSKDQLKTNLIAQFMIEDPTVPKMIENFLNIFEPKNFDENDQNDLKKKGSEFTDVYHILKINNCKIANILKWDYAPSHNMSIRIQRIPDWFNDENLVGFVPVYYGASYNRKDLIVSFGDPFFMPIYKDDLDKQNDLECTDTKVFDELEEIVSNKLLKKESYLYLVTDFKGKVQKDLKWYHFEKIMNKKEDQFEAFRYYIAIVVTNMGIKEKINGAYFMDEVQYFKENPFEMLKDDNFLDKK